VRVRIAIGIGSLPEELARRAKAHREAVMLGVRNAARRTRAHLVRRTPKDQGLAKQAWRDTANATLLHPGVVAEVFNDAPYIGILEEGARPHAVSEEGQRAILEWVRRHYANFVGRDRARFVKRRFANYAEIEIKEIAEAIVWKLRTQGQEPTYFVRDSLPEITRFTATEIDRAVRALADRKKLN
jgi:hypothetical protein